MTNYKMILQYDGTRYRGWQIQKNTDATIQGKLQQVLTSFAGEPVEVQGSGRTDAGVHAYGQVANVKLKQDVSEEELRAYLNSYLPDDIGVLSVEKVPIRFHSRLSATAKTYRYRIHTGTCKNVFERKYVYDMQQPLDIDAMRQAAAYLVGTHDFKAFCGNKKMKKSTVRHLYAIDIQETQEELVVTFHGDGFLQHMIRIIMGTLVEVGQKKRSPKEMKEILESRDREKAGYTIPPQGLALMQVSYELAGGH